MAISSNVLRICGKVLAGGVVAGVLYDTNDCARKTSMSYKKTRDAAAVTDAYLYSFKSDSRSRIKSKYKNWVRNIRVDNDLRTACNAVVGYFKGAGEMLTNHAVPTALATATLLTKGKASIACAGGLAIWGLTSLIKTTFGMGEYNKVLKEH